MLRRLEPDGRQCSTNSLRCLASPAAITDLRAINAPFIENFIRNDVKSHDAILHADFIYIPSNGARMDRTTHLKRSATGFDPQVIVYWDVRDDLITLVGNGALVRATEQGDRSPRRSGYRGDVDL